MSRQAPHIARRHPTGTPAALPYAEADESGPAAQISRRAADRLRAGHLWVYRSDIEQLIPALGNGQLPGGSILTLLDSRRIPLGSALFSDSSEITLRKISNEPRVSRGEYLEDTRHRIRAALSLRAPMLEAGPVEAGSLATMATGKSDSVRLLFAEADNLPGIIVDRYNNLILLQLLTQGTAQEDIRELLAEELAAPGVTVILERPDPRIRELESLPAPPAAPLFLSPEGNQKDSRNPSATAAEIEDSIHNQTASYAKIKAGSRNHTATAAEIEKLQTVFTLNGLRFHYDANSGQKTGAFLDQRLNYDAAMRHAQATRSTSNHQPFRALDICTYQGGFALHLAQVCTHVTGIDSSLAALEVAEQNLALNRDTSPKSLAAEVDWIEADAFELLRSFDAEDRRFEVIVLDPPAFAKSRRAVEGALRGYKELNLRALRMLSPGGILVTCSCSHHISLQAFTETVAAAASDAHRHVRLLETRAAAPDHPEVLTLPETRYLKCLILQVH